MKKLIVIILFLHGAIVVGKCNNLQSAVMEAKVDDSTIQVIIQYELTVSKETNQIPFRLIEGDLATLSNLKVIMDGTTFPFELQSENARVKTGTLSFKKALTIGQSYRIKVEYQLNKGVLDKRLTIPVLFPDVTPIQADASFFTAQLWLPDQYVLESIFPAMRWTKKEGIYTFDLQVIPAWVKFDCYSGKLPLFGLERLVDVGVMVVLLGLIFVGWKKLKI